MVIDIVYDEPNPKKYSHIRLGQKEFKSGDFIKDWFNVTKFLCEARDDEDWEPIMFSSSVDHFIQDGAPFDSAYLHMENDVPILRYFDRTNPQWFMTEIDNGIEFFVPEGEQWTWEKLKEYCK